MSEQLSLCMQRGANALQILLAERLEGEGRVARASQASASVPPLDASAQAAYERCGLPLAWAERVWSVVLECLLDAKSSKRNNAAEYKRYHQTIRSEVYLQGGLKVAARASPLLGLRLVLLLCDIRGENAALRLREILTADVVGAAGMAGERWSASKDKVNMTFHYQSCNSVSVFEACASS
eukprot:360874-Chlamydomonas_euryale.AAC.6